MKTNHKSFKPDYTEDAPTLEQVNGLVGDTILEFGAPWCGHCQAAYPAIQEVLSEHTELSHIKVYDGKGKRLGRAFRVKLWPTLILLHDGKEVARLIRPIDVEEVRQFVEQSESLKP
jgi:thioredoxin 1